MLPELNENESTNYQNRWDRAKAVLRRAFIAMNIKSTLKSQIKVIMLHLKVLEKQEQAKPKTSRRRETIKIGPISTK
jgi:hypothetical protein